MWVAFTYLLGRLAHRLLHIAVPPIMTSGCKILADSQLLTGRAVGRSIALPLNPATSELLS